MSWHKHQEYDPTEAFVQNARQQKLLELKLDDIDKLWYAQLKHLARERLDATNELKILEETKKDLQHYDKNMLVSDLKKYTDGVINQFRQIERENSRDNFNFETRAMQVKRLSVSLPSLNQLGIAPLPVRTSLKKKKIKTQRRRHKTSTSSKLKSTRLKSISDSNLHKSSKFEESKLAPSSADAKSDRQKALGSLFPPISHQKLSSAKSDDHRYLKHKMATSLELPPVVEVNTHRSRKLSL